MCDEGLRDSRFVARAAHGDPFRASLRLADVSPGGHSPARARFAAP